MAIEELMLSDKTKKTQKTLELQTTTKTTIVEKKWDVYEELMMKIVEQMSSQRFEDR